MRWQLASRKQSSVDGLLSLQEMGEGVSRIKTLGPQTSDEQELLALYEAAKGAGRIDFQDLLILTAQLLSTHPDWLDRPALARPLHG